MLEIERRTKPDMRERVKQKGARSLSDCELLAVALRTGTRNTPVMSLAQRVVRELEEGRPESVFERLCGIDGMGEGKASAVIAALEIGRRFNGTARQKVSCAKDVFPLIAHFADRKQEQFICVSLNGAHEVIGIRVVSVGTVNRTLVHPREVFADPLEDRAAAVIVCHNHPSGQLEPSEEDRNITKRLVEVGEILGIPVLDHLILSPHGGYYSFVESGQEL